MESISCWVLQRLWCTKNTLLWSKVRWGRSSRAHRLSCANPNSCVMRSTQAHALSVSAGLPFFPLAIFVLSTFIWGSWRSAVYESQDFVPGKEWLLSCLLSHLLLLCCLFSAERLFGQIARVLSVCAPSSAGNMLGWMQFSFAVCSTGMFSAWFLLLLCWKKTLNFRPWHLCC